MVSFQEEKMTKLSHGEFKDIAEKNFGESEYAAIGKFGAEKEFYESLELKGILKFYTARRDNKLVGYGIFLFVIHPHMHETVIARQDSLYCSEKGIGLKLLKFCEGKLKEAGAKGVISMVGASSDRTKAFNRLGYQMLERVYIKEF